MCEPPSASEWTGGVAGGACCSLGIETRPDVVDGYLLSHLCESLGRFFGSDRRRLTQAVRTAEFCCTIASGISCCQRPKKIELGQSGKLLLDFMQCWRGCLVGLLDVRRTSPESDLVFQRITRIVLFARETRLRQIREL